MEITTYDGEQHEVLRVTGEVRGALVVPSRREVALGDVPHGCTKSDSVVFHNRGNEPARITDVRIVDPTGNLRLDPTWEIAFPLDLDVDDLAPEGLVVPLIAHVTYRSYGAEVVVAYDDGLEATLGVIVSASTFRDTTVSAVVPDQLAHDLILTVDRAVWDAPELDVAGELDDLAAEVARSPDDLRVTLVVEDDGCVLGGRGWIDPTVSASEARRVIATMADGDFDLGHYGVLGDAGFTLGLEHQSRENTRSDGCNSTFRRQWADLSFAHVSVRDEGSAPPPAYFVELARTKVEWPYHARFHGAVGSVPDGCGPAAPGDRYAQAAGLTGGQLLSICTPGWGAALIDGLTWSPPTSLATLPLGSPAVPDSVRVEVDRYPRLTGWTVDGDRLRFDPPLAPGASVLVRFQPISDCPSD